MIQSLYFNAMPDHLKPKREAGASSNRALKGSDRDNSGRYAVAKDAEHYFKRKVLPKIEAARARGDVVRFINGRWYINNQPLKV